jgi:hypothetical protein
MKKFMSLRASIRTSLRASALVLASCSGHENSLFTPSGNDLIEAGPASDGAADTGTNDADQVDADAEAPLPDSPVADATADAVDARPIGCAPGVLGHCSSASYPEYPGFTLKLVEDFDEPLDLVADPNWTYSDGMPDGDYTRFAKQAVSFAGGNAVITATKPSGGVVGDGYPTYAEGVEGFFPKPVVEAPVLSGELRTKHNNWRYGRFEARVKPALNSNVTSAFFTFRSPKWQEWRSLTFDLTPENAPTRAGTNIIYGNSCLGYGCTVNAYSALPVPSLAGGGTIYDDFYTYTIENMPDAVKWYVDNALIRTETSNLAEKSMKVLLDLYVFYKDSWGGGSPLDNTYPMSMQIDWVRLYKANVDPTYPCSPLPDCQPAEDRDDQKNNAEDGLPAAAPW